MTFDPTKLVGFRRPKSPDTILVENALKKSGVPTQVADLRSMTGLAPRRLASIIANLRQRNDVSYISGEGYVLGPAVYASPTAPGLVKIERESIKHRGSLHYAGMAAPVRPGANDHLRYPSRIGDELVYNNK